MTMSQQKERYEADLGRLSKEIAQMKERFQADAARLQDESTRMIAHFTAQVAFLEEKSRNDETAAYRAFRGELQAEKAASHELRQELEAANRLVARASAVGPAAAVEQKHVHKMTMMEYGHEEAIKAEASKHST